MTVLVAMLVGYLALVIPTPTRMRYLGMFIVRLLIQCVMLPVRLYCMVLNVFLAVGCCTTDASRTSIHNHPLQSL
jgi:hypothetical protein